MSKDRRAKAVAVALDIGYAHAFRLTRVVMAETERKFEIEELIAACRVQQETEEKRRAALSGWKKESGGHRDD